MKNIIRTTSILGLLMFAFTINVCAEVPLTPGEKSSFVKLLCTTNGDHKPIAGSVAAVAAAVPKAMASAVAAVVPSAMTAVSTAMAAVPAMLGRRRRHGESHAQ